MLRKLGWDHEGYDARNQGRSPMPGQPLNPIPVGDYIEPDTITTEMLQDGSVTQEKLAGDIAGIPGPEGPPGPPGPAGPQGEPGPPSEGVSATWNWRVADGTTDPGIRNLAPDVAAAPTMLRFSTTTVAGSDARNVLVTTQAGDVLLMQQRTDSTKWAKVQVSAAPIDHGTWFEVPIIGIANGTGGQPANNQDVLVNFQRTGTSEVQAYRHVQATAATTWSITHNLSFRPNVAAVDSTGREIWPGATDYTSATTVQLTFSAAVGGEAYLS